MITYQSIHEPCEARIKIQRSDFHGFLFPISNVEQARELIAIHSKTYNTATHNCYAYVLGFTREVQHFSDAGEPAGTAGKPILNTLLSAGMTNVLAIVTRYYGGVKLGVRGLIEAYGQSTQLALSAAQLIPAIPCLCFEVVCDYRTADAVKRHIKDAQGKIIFTGYDDTVHLTVQIPAAASDVFMEFLNGYAVVTGLEYKQKQETS